MGTLWFAAEQNTHMTGVTLETQGTKPVGQVSLGFHSSGGQWPLRALLKMGLWPFPTEFDFSL